MKWMILPYLRYFDFSGRSRRLEYWMFTLFYVLVCVVFVVLLVASMVDLNMKGSTRPPGPAFWVGLSGLGLFLLGSFIPSISVAVRRFHDQDLSGWMYLLAFIPYIGSIVLIVFMCIDGTRGENRFGYDPKGRGAAGLADVFT